MSPLRRDQVAIGLVAAMLVALEIVWTRIFSAEFFYSFAFLVVSLAVLGLGLGALSLRFWPTWATSPRIGTAALVASGTAVLGPTAITRLPIEFVALWRSGPHPGLCLQRGRARHRHRWRGQYATLSGARRLARGAARGRTRVFARPATADSRTRLA